jgi:hypothetical protein
MGSNASLKHKDSLRNDKKKAKKINKNEVGGLKTKIVKFC